MLFSRRKGYIKARDVIQVESLDELTKNRLWSCLHENVVMKYAAPHSRRANYLSPVRGSSLEPFVTVIWDKILGYPTDTIPSDINDAVEEIRNCFFKSEWFKTFDILQVAYFYLPYIRPNEQSFLRDEYQYKINNILQQENVGHRMMDGEIIPITDETEIGEIDSATKTTYDPVRNHLQESLKFLTDRKNPSFRNSIKESISAIEALAIIKTGDKGTLGKLLKRLNLHPSLQQGLSKIYGYASDADGIRHALSEESTVGYEDAKFFLVLSSAFVNSIL